MVQSSAVSLSLDTLRGRHNQGSVLMFFYPNPAHPERVQSRASSREGRPSTLRLDIHSQCPVYGPSIICILTYSETLFSYLTRSDPELTSRSPKPKP